MVPEGPFVLLEQAVSQPLPLLCAPGKGSGNAPPTNALQNPWSSAKITKQVTAAFRWLEVTRRVAVSCRNPRKWGDAGPWLSHHNIRQSHAGSGLWGGTTFSLLSFRRDGPWAGLPRPPCTCRAGSEILHTGAYHNTGWGFVFSFTLRVQQKTSTPHHGPRVLISVTRACFPLLSRNIKIFFRG